MADIIDLDFYRKFRVVLPVQASTYAKNKSYKRAYSSIKPCRRRRKTETRFFSKPKNVGEDGS